jgi:two-component system NtrC family sensor kinase
MSYSILKTYIANVLIGLAVILLASQSGPAYAIGAFVLAAGSFYFTRRLAQEAEKAAKKALQFEEQLYGGRQLSSVDQLSAGIAHEINNPLAIIAQETQWLQHLLQSSTINNTKEADECRESVQVISIQVDRSKEIVQKLLSLARQMDPVIQSVDINKLVENMVSIMEREAKTKNIGITKELLHNLPLVSSDPPLLRQVILNLMVNASHAIEQNGTITVGTRVQGNYVDITVEDTGCGIPQENLNKIFTPFFSTKPQGKGTGLGLAICRGIVEKLGGYVSVTSEVGKNTVFTVRLPTDSSSKGAN